MKFSWKRIIDSIFIVIFLAGISTGVYELVVSQQAKVAWADWIQDKREHYLSCYDLPFYPQVQKTFNGQHGEVVKLKSLGAIDVTAVKNVCKGWSEGVEFIKGDVLITDHNRSQKNAIEKYLGQTFFGIPYRIEPVK